MLTRRKILVIASVVISLCFYVGYWLVPHLRAARALCTIVNSLSDAQALLIEGYFIDEQPLSGTNISVRLTNHADIVAIASLFQSATPRLDLSTTYAISRGAKLGSSLAGTVTIELVDSTNKLHYLTTDLIVGSTDTVMQLQGFCSLAIYQTLKQRGVLSHLQGDALGH